MSDQFITLIAAAIGAAIALVGVFFTERGNTARLKIQLEDEARKRKKELLTDRGEELYELVDKWDRSIISFIVIKQRVMEGKLDYHQGNKLMVEQEEKKDWNFSRITMLTNVYFPDINDAYNDAVSSQISIVEIVSAHIQEYEAGTIDGKKFLEQLRTRKEEMSLRIAELKLLVLDKIRAI